MTARQAVMPPLLTRGRGDGDGNGDPQGAALRLGSIRVSVKGTGQGEVGFDSYRSSYGSAYQASDSGLVAAY